MCFTFYFSNMSLCTKYDFQTVSLKIVIFTFATVGVEKHSSWGTSESFLGN